MKYLTPQCPLCSERIVFDESDFEQIVCPSCEISWSGFELFDSLPLPETPETESILPFGVLVSKTPKTGLLTKLVRNMERMFELVVSRQAPGESCSEAHLMAYLISLVEGQRGEIEESMPGSWALVSDPAVSNDERDEFVHLPTYLAVSTLCFALREIPGVTREIPALRRAIQRGLDAATLGGLSGHGPKWLDWRQRILGLFERGKVLDLLREQPEISHSMCYVLGYAHERTVEILSKTQGPIAYQTPGPVPRDIYERIASRTEAFRHFCGEGHFLPSRGFA